MTEAEILARVSGIVGDILGHEQLALAPSMTAADVEGWDSLSHVQIIVALEKAFAIRFRAGEMASIADVGDLVGRIAKRIA